VEQHDENRALDAAIDSLVDAMSRIEQAAFRESAGDAIRRTVHELLKDAGKVD
jgi:hypothetical protein